MPPIRALHTPLAPVVPSSGALQALGLDAVTITGGFWDERRTTNRTGTLPHILYWLERAGWLRNFDLAAVGSLPAGRSGRSFADSEIYKYLEAVAWQLGTDPSDELESTFRSVVARIGLAQEPDGYLNTYFGRRGQQPRWSDLEWGHELYCLGHLFQAAVARHRVAPCADDGLVEIATRAADLVCRTFDDDGIASVCGHPEIETGLAELGRALNEPRYLRQAALFVARRGHHLLHDIEWGRAYYQDETPVRLTTVLHGHAVRANYLAAGAVDVAVETADDELLNALQAQWERTVARRTYITGGQGAHHQDEGFGADYELPPDRAYSETCAGIGSIMFSWRLLLATGDERYADLIERTLFNVVATSPAADGRSFYYANTLHQREAGVEADEFEVSARASASLRAPWFDVSCCPPNVARTLASLPGYVATTNEEGVQLHQFVPGTVRAVAPDGAIVQLRIETSYPADGLVRVQVQSDINRPWTLRLRVPGWANGATVRVLSDQEESAATPAAVGAVEVTRAFRAGDIIELTLPLEPRFTYPDDRIDAVRNSVAIERGPEVLCLESIDLPAQFIHSTVNEVFVAADPALQEHDGSVRLTVQARTEAQLNWPYGTDSTSPETVTGSARLIPYHDWANRGPSTMRVWLPLP